MKYLAFAFSTASANEPWLSISCKQTNDKETSSVRLAHTARLCKKWLQFL